MLDEQDKENSATDLGRAIEKRVQEYEAIIAQLKRACPEGKVDSVRLCNDTSIHLEEVGMWKINIQF